MTRYVDATDGAEYLYSLLVPADAHQLFPCFDQPDIKARLSLELELPAAWVAVANGRETPSEPRRRIPRSSGLRACIT